MRDRHREDGCRRQQQHRQALLERQQQEQLQHHHHHRQPASVTAPIAPSGLDASQAYPIVSIPYHESVAAYTTHPQLHAGLVRPYLNPSNETFHEYIWPNMMATICQTMPLSALKNTKKKKKKKKKKKSKNSQQALRLVSPSVIYFYIQTYRMVHWMRTYSCSAFLPQLTRKGACRDLLFLFRPFSPFSLSHICRRNLWGLLLSFLC